MNDTSISASRTIDAPADAIFTFLSNPAHHAALDGSGMVQSDSKSDRITGVGQMFTMNQNWDKMGGDYQTDNHVVGYDENKLLAWKTAPWGRSLRAGNGCGGSRRPVLVPPRCPSRMTGPVSPIRTSSRS